MSGRRSHVRFEVIQPPEGVLRVMRDVTVQRIANGEVIAVGQEAGVLDEVVVLEFPGDENACALRARVVESQPVMMNGTVRHRLRLQELRPGSPSGDAASTLQRGSSLS